MMPGLPMDLCDVAPWSSNWMWSLPIIIVTVVFHAYALELLNQGVTFVLKNTHKRHITRMLSLFIVGGSALCATVLFSVDVGLWAMAYRLLEAIPNWKSAMLYSLIAMTTYGETNIHLEPHWQLMGSLEALDGWILFGLTTAFLFTVLQKVWSDHKLDR